MMRIPTNLLLRTVCVGMIVITLLAGALPGAAQADGSTSSIGVGRGPHAAAVNPLTNKVYVVNATSNSVSVIDDTYHSVETVEVGTAPYAVAVNPVTNKIYVANADSDNVTVIDGETNSTVTVEAGSIPFAAAVNTETNKIYIANLGSDDVTVIDGVTNDTFTVDVGESPFALTVNPITNRIYVANVDSNNITVIDGANDTVITTLPAGSGPNAIAVNPLTGYVYVTNFYSSSVTIIDGATNSTSTITVGTTPNALAVNEVTDKIYVVNDSSNDVSVIDGASSTVVSTLQTGMGPNALAIHSAANQIYVANYDSNNVTVIDGSTEMMTTVPVGSNPIAIAVSPLSGSVYAVNFNSNEITVYRAHDGEQPPSTNPDLSQLVVNSGTLQPVFDPEVLAYTVNVGHEAASLSVTAVTYDPLTTMSINGQLRISGVPVSISLNVGANQVSIVTQAKDGIHEKTYSLTVNRASAPPVSPPSATPLPNEGPSEQPAVKAPTDFTDVRDGTNGVTLGSRTAVVSATMKNGKSVVQMLLHADVLAKAFDMLKDKEPGKQIVTFEVETADAADAVRKVGIPAPILMAAAKATPQAILSIKAGNAAYDLPVNLPVLVSLLQQLGSELNDTIVFITMETVTGVSKQQMFEKIKAAGHTLVGDVLDFTMTVETGGNKENGTKKKQQTLSDFGDKYVSRSLLIAGTLDPVRATGVKIDAVTGDVSFVPSFFRTTAAGVTIVNILRTGNSMYGVVQNDKSFNDLQDHWSKSDVELLASKLIVQGTTDSSFAPEHPVTRAEFVAMITRALGFEEKPALAKEFNDINGMDWFAGTVGAAVEARLISGFEDGTFRPYETITREQMAIVVSGALTFVGKPAAVAGKLNPLLSSFKDKAVISSWAQVSVAQMAESGMMSGMTDDTFAPKDLASRAQAAVIIKRLLQHAGFIN
ncbi:S-layer homology domain-containing protein [Paenibacillus eucommiae]|uniref:YVTN family beta-propeller protein n=1 Tax=Paenibacillus eucommiae TaxID=1355755 RepID=A0ABS4IT50_9BACL|nr:S-layer homology domain-containing protein [Paenibacillus eucommiae]MBP1990310.1 YVTN family beta-propeller protein [Paenibacillus eucommiae]